MLQALALLAQGRRPAAVESLVRAIEQAPELDGFVRLFLDEGEPMRGLLGDAARSVGAGGHARRLFTLAASEEGDAHSLDRPSVDQPSVDRPSGLPSSDALTDRELQVLRLLDSELSGPEIARALFVSHNTLRTHTKHIFTKLDVSSRRAAVVRARERGLL